MCSLMEKDVLLEEVSATAAFICRNAPNSGSSSNEFKRCAQIRDFLYLNDPEDIDAKAIRQELSKLKSSFLSKSVH